MKGNARMNFIICFKNKINYAYNIEKKVVVGMDIIEDIRKKFKKNIPIDKIFLKDSSSSGICFYYYVKDEKNIKKIKHFNVRNKIDVTVPENFLNQYFKLNYEKVCINFLGIKILSNINVVWALEADLIFEDWLKAGQPLDWKC